MSEFENEDLSRALLLRESENLSATEKSLLLTAANNGGLEIFNDADGINIGYIVYANINKYSLLSLLHNGSFPRYFYEWSEGNICLIHNVFIMPDRAYEAIKKLKEFLRKKRALAYMKKGKAVYLIRKKNKYYKGIRKQFVAAPIMAKKDAA